MNRLNTILILAAVSLAWLSGAGAFAEGVYTPQPMAVSQDGDVHYNPFAGEYRFVFSHQDSFDLDAEKTKGPVKNWGEHHIRYSPSLNWRELYFKIDLDILHGMLFGDKENFAPGLFRLDRRDRDYGRDIKEILPRQAYIQWRSSAGVLKIGQMQSGHGLGMVSNNGQEEPDRANGEREEPWRFGVKRYGDIVDRLLFATTPFLPLSGKNEWGDYLTFLLAADLVFRDANAHILDGDRAVQGDFGIMFRHPDYTNGALFTYRWQRDDDGDTLTASVLNINGKNRFPIRVYQGRAELAPPVPAEEKEAAALAREIGATSDGKPVEATPVSSFDMAFRLDYEVAFLWGFTDRLQQDNTPEGIDLRGIGAIGRVGYELPAAGFDVEFELGYASGENNPYGGAQHAFFFNPDYKVGLIFFDEMLPLISARSVEMLSDPNRSAQAPKGLDLIPSQGRVTNALYYFPQVRYSPPLKLSLDEKLTIMAGALVITSPAYFSQAYYTYANGGGATNQFKRLVSSHYLGTELLAGVQFKFFPLHDHIGLKFSLQQSYFLPGAALENLKGQKPDGVWKIVAGTALDWQ